MVNRRRAPGAYVDTRELAALLRVRPETISRLLSRFPGELTEEQGVFRLGYKTLRFNPTLAVPAISRVYRQYRAKHHVADIAARAA
ncbi:MAG: hypothetical protein WA721_14635 [Candidatus Binataceae bacterium]